MKINNGGANLVLHICCSKPWFPEFPILIFFNQPNSFDGTNKICSKLAEIFVKIENWKFVKPCGE